MSTPVAIAVMVSNYVHDVATGLLLLSALWLAWSARDLGDRPEPAVLRLFYSAYCRCLRFVRGSILVIIATGAVRAVYFMRFEWFPALGKGLVPVLVMKHVLIFTMLGVGIYTWSQLRRRLAAIPGWKTLAQAPIAAAVHGDTSAKATTEGLA